MWFEMGKSGGNILQGEMDYYAQNVIGLVKTSNQSLPSLFVVPILAHVMSLLGADSFMSEYDNKRTFLKRISTRGLIYRGHYNTLARRYINFIFEWRKQYFTSEHSGRVKCPF